ncbi:sugar transferase [Rhodopirellula sallentina]|uniref:Undecaprenyl-phosphate galactosephosphotransferase n=1 Tax=Rhodopirellula sallentina SM41 TaxID=1263870 RepID=M5U651_9BACT|nr:sugar transferase [Rhodopirellula sallentina]EMI56930.1 undecaprenyl-phosphate galactosephosphotransferase [Rhodopirellula sallentina SM41]
MNRTAEQTGAHPLAGHTRHQHRITQQSHTHPQEKGMSAGSLSSRGKHHSHLDGEHASWRNTGQNDSVGEDDIDSIARQSPQFYRLHCPERCKVFFQRKYFVDRALGGLMLFFASPFIAALYLLVRFTSRGPGFYRQERVGLNGQTFDIIKLRSMVVDAEKPGKPQWACKNDPRVNCVGQMLRKLHLDELPQLWNVCRGDMSLVGPRPERPQICDDLAKEIDGYYQRIAVKPGVTGLAQINLPPDESIADVRRKQILDLHYIENASLWLDARMMMATALRLIGLKGVIVTRLMCLDRLDLVKDACIEEDGDRILPPSVVCLQSAPIASCEDSEQFQAAFAFAGAGEIPPSSGAVRRPR